MAKLVLGQPPKSFKRNVTFKLIDGSDAVIECEFKYRTRKEFGSFIDGVFTDADEPATGEFSMKKLMERTSLKNAEYLAEVLEGWNLDVDLDKTALEQLADEVPSAVAAIMEAYRTGVLEGRLGN
jgi:hypothetical protein